MSDQSPIHLRAGLYDPDQITVRVDGDEHPRFAVDADGTIRQGDGTSPPAPFEGGGGGPADASEVAYDNQASGLAATDVQAAIDEVVATGGGPADASDVTYDNSESGLSATDVQAAIDELAEREDKDEQTAAEVPYDNQASGLSAEDAQAAIDELAGAVAGLDIPADASDLHYEDRPAVSVPASSVVSGSVNLDPPLTFDLTVDGGSVQPVSLGGEYTGEDIAAQLATALNGVTSGVTWDGSTGALVATAASTGPGSSITIANLEDFWSDSGLQEGTWEGATLSTYDRVEEVDQRITGLQTQLQGQIGYVPQVWPEPPVILGEAPTDTDFTGNDVTFTLAWDDGDSTSDSAAITLDDDYGDAWTVADAIASQTGYVVDVSPDGSDVLQISGPGTGVGATLTISDYTETGAASAGLADGLAAGTDGESYPNLGSWVSVLIDRVAALTARVEELEGET